MFYKYLLKIIWLFAILLVLFSNYACFAEGYIWSDYSETELLDTSSETQTDLELESGGAILIEQTTRNCLV